MDIDKLDNCPECGNSWDGGSIIDTFVEKSKTDNNTYWAGKSKEEIERVVKESYSPPYRWGRLIGIELQGQYDGISIWECPDCKTQWDRFTNQEILNSKDIK